MIDLLILGAGISIGVFVLTYYCFKYLEVLWQKLLPYKNRLTRILGESPPGETPKSREPPILLYGMIAGLLIGLLATIGTRFFMQGTLMGVCLGAIFSLVVKKSIEDTTKIRQMKELALIYETSVFYASAGYTLYQSLEKSRDMVKLLRPALDKCLAAWPYGSIRAIYSFGEEVDFPEAKVMAGIFAHVEEKGSAFSEAAIIEESQSLENLRKTLTEIKILSKPLYFAVYRALPLLAICGIIIGSLVNRVIIMLSSLMGM
jgi:hypothetical protein